MKLHARLHRGSELVDREVELLACDGPNSARRFRIGDAEVEADCAEIASGVYSILLKGKSYQAFVSNPPGEVQGPRGHYVVAIGAGQYRVELRDPRQRRLTGASFEEEGPQEIVAPMPGKIVKILVAEGQEVEKDQGLLVIEAMKMQNELRAPRAGRVERVYRTEGGGVETGVPLLRLV
jgi:biotin carboxyl carrier protein